KYFSFDISTSQLSIIKCNLPNDGIARSYLYHPGGWYQSTKDPRYKNEEGEWIAYAEHYRIDRESCSYDTIGQQNHGIENPLHVYGFDYKGGVFYENQDGINSEVYYSETIYADSAELVYLPPK